MTDEKRNRLLQSESYNQVSRRAWAHDKLAEWYKENHEFDCSEPKDDRKRRCRKDFPTVACALSVLAEEREWHPGCWRKALSIWSEEDLNDLAKKSWCYLAPALADVPDNWVQSVDDEISKWLESVAAAFDKHEELSHEELFTTLCGRVLKVNSQKGNDDGKTDGRDFFSKAINHSVGKVTEALLRWWGRQPLKDGQGLSGVLRKMFTDLCDPGVKNFRHGRVLLATRVIALFRVDREWTTEHLLPLFDWQRSPSEACATWQGFLRSPLLYHPLMEEIKLHFLATVKHYDELDRWGEQYSGFLAITALLQPDIFDQGELAKATDSLPPEGLHQTACALVRALKDEHKQQLGDYWESHMQPYLKSVWPQSRHHVTPDISERFAELCVAAREKFPEAIETLDPWLQRLSFQGSAVTDLDEFGLCHRFPALALRFLDRIISDNYDLPDELRPCLESIRQAEPRLAVERQFHRLKNILHQHGINLD